MGLGKNSINARHSTMKKNDFRFIAAMVATWDLKNPLGTVPLPRKKDLFVSGFSITMVHGTLKKLNRYWNPNEKIKCFWVQYY